MNRVLGLLTHRFGHLTVRSAEFHVPSSSVITPPPPSLRIPQVPAQEPLPEPSSVGRIVPLTCPTLNSRQIFSLPSLLNNAPRVAPPPLSQAPAKVVPEVDRAPMEAPSALPLIKMWLSPRLKTIRRKKMKKHKRRRRYDRDFFKYQKYHKEKKLRAEREFVARMKGHLAELEAFDPEKYVEDTIARAKREWTDELAPTGRKLYPHWSRLMALEELYGLPKSDYIDKRAGYPTEEDRDKIRQLKEQYKRDFLGELPSIEEKKENK